MDNRQQTAFDTVKAAISHDCIMAYYDPAKTTRLTVDGSPHGLWAILSNIDQDVPVRNVAYASRSLSPTEQRYSDNELKLNLLLITRPSKLFIRQSQNLLRGGLSVCSGMSIKSFTSEVLKTQEIFCHECHYQLARLN